jgi:RimJ/RimL family protein N-acetyltransferase
VDDADNLVNLDADPDVMRFVTGGMPTSRDEIENEVLPAFLRYYERYEGYGFWAAIEKATGDFLGWFHFRPPQDAIPGEVELGYRLRKSAWGKGYATEGSRALIRKGFTELGVQRVVAGAMAVNTASRRVMEKAGLTLVRTFHQPWPYPIEGDQFGGVEYALDQADWQQQEQARTGGVTLPADLVGSRGDVRCRVRFSCTEARRACLAGQRGWISPIGPKPSCGVSM